MTITPERNMLHMLPTVYLLGNQLATYRSFWVSFEKNFYGERLELRGYDLTKELAQHLLSLDDANLNRMIPTDRPHWLVSYNTYHVGYCGSRNEPMYIHSVDEFIPFLLNIAECDYKKVTLCVSDLRADDNARSYSAITDEPIIFCVTDWCSNNLDFTFMRKKNEIHFSVKEVNKPFANDYLYKIYGGSLILSLDLYIRVTPNNMDYKSICYHGMVTDSKITTTHYLTKSSDMRIITLKVDISRFMDSLEYAYIKVTSPTGRTIILYKIRAMRASERMKNAFHACVKSCNSCGDEPIEVQVTLETMRDIYEFSLL